MGSRVYQGLACLLGVWLCATSVAARTMYTTDTFEIVVRSAKQIVGRNIIKVLPSGAPLEVRDLDDVWASVRLEDGRTGFVETKQLIEREPYKVTAERLQLEISQHRERTATLTQHVTNLRQAEAQLHDISQKYEQLRQDANTAEQLETKAKYTALQQAHAETLQQLAALNEAHTSLQNSTRLSWFLGGAGVILTGWVLGLTSARWRGRRRQTGYSYNLPH